MQYKAMLFVAGIMIPLVAPAAAQTAAPPKSIAPAGATQEQDDMARRNQEFSETLTGSVWEGHFTVDGHALTDLKRERYEIAGVEKLPVGDLWMFKARIVYGQHDLTVPVPLQIKWAGRTPVITLDDVTLPGLGTFSARVVIADGKYAGTWRHDENGGHLFGTIRKQPPPENQP